MSQDTEATVCAHTALWSVCRYLSERYTVYPETYPYDFITGTTDTNGRTAPYRKMTYTDYSRLLTRFGCHPEILFMREDTTNLWGKKTSTLSAEKLTRLYTYVESGFPVLASFRGHVVSLVGHTMDLSRTPKPNQHGWIDSSGYLKQFVVVDDNRFPYQLLGYKSDPDNYAQAYRVPPQRICRHSCDRDHRPLHHSRRAPRAALAAAPTPSRPYRAPG
jgi:hypothetical protein